MRGAVVMVDLYGYQLPEEWQKLRSEASVQQSHVGVHKQVQGK
jgi:GH25 family lysozyme M1 (1,4-beta-N-acetylmuramidase)